MVEGPEAANGGDIGCRIQPALSHGPIEFSTKIQFGAISLLRQQCEQVASPPLIGRTRRKAGRPAW